MWNEFIINAFTFTLGNITRMKVFVREIAIDCLLCHHFTASTFAVVAW